MSEAYRPLTPDESPSETPSSIEGGAAQPPVRWMAGKNGGQLKVGNPGNRGGPGVPPSKIRAAAREALFPRLVILEEIADGVTHVPLVDKCPECGYEPTHQERVEALKDRPKPGERVAAIREMGKLGMSAVMNVDDVKERLIRLVRATRGYLADKVTPEQVAELLDLMHAEFRS